MNNSKNLNKYSEQILDCLFKLQKNNQCISESTFAKDTLLILLSAYKELNLSELTSLTNCQQSYISQIVKKLLKDKSIKVRYDKNDLRYRYYCLTANGKRIVNELDEISNLTLNQILDKLNKIEIKKLTSYISKLNDYASIAKQICRNEEHPFRAEQRRLAALIGVTRKNIFNLDISSTKFSILRIIHKYNGLLTIKNIAEELGLLPSQVSNILKEYYDLQYISYIDNPYDSRSKLILLNKLGVKEYTGNKELLLEYIKRPLNNFSASELKSFSGLFIKLLKEELDIEKIPKNKNHTHRSKIIKFTFENNNLEHLPSTIASKDCNIYAFTNNNEIISYLQVDSNEIARILCWESDTEIYQIYDFLRKLKENVNFKLKSTDKPFNLFSIL